MIDFAFGTIVRPLQKPVAMEQESVGVKNGFLDPYLVLNFLHSM